MVNAEDVPIWGWVLVGLGAVLLLIIVVSWATAEPYFDLTGKVVVITGGSSGIGKASAQLALQRGAHVAILARKTSLLSEAVAQLEPFKRASSQRLTTHSVDVADDERTRMAFVDITAAHGGVVDVLINSAGISLPKTFAETSASEFLNVYNVNVVGTRNATHAALPYMTRGGRIVFVSSQAGQVGVYGYTAYSASKFALTGFAQALQQEVLTRNIRVSLCFPPDTDTPMLAEENKLKPDITKLLSQSTAMVPPEAVAKDLVSGIIHWSPQIGCGFDGWMLATVTSGMGPAATLWQGVVQIFTMGLWRLVALFVLKDFYFTIRKHDRGNLNEDTQRPSRFVSAGKGSSGPVVDEDSKNK